MLQAISRRPPGRFQEVSKRSPGSLQAVSRRSPGGLQAVSRRFIGGLQTWLAPNCSHFVTFTVRLISVVFILFLGENAPKCLDFRRSRTTECQSGNPESNLSSDLFNEITHFVDASNVYGSSQQTLQILRNGLHGKMEGGNESDSKPIISFLLPNQFDECDKNKHLGFKAGDVRVNENPGKSQII